MHRALVLSGGGAKGSWQVGACKHLIAERGHWFDVISGVSVGAINGATLAHGHDPEGLKAHLERLRKWWFGVRGNHNIYRRRRFGVLGLALGKWAGLYDVTPLREEVLRREIDPPQVAASPIRLRVGYIDLRSGRYRTAGNNHPRLRDALLASSSLPILFPPTPLPENGDIGVDGGTRHVALMADALRALAELPPDSERPEVWMVMPRPPHKVAPGRTVKKWLKKAVSLLSVVNDAACVEETSGTLARHCHADPDAIHERCSHFRLRVLHPARELPGSFLDFDPAKIRAWYDDGLRTARADARTNLG
jgi:hypothetical protein